MMPSQKYGTEERNVVTGSRPSAHEPRRQPASTPRPVPRKKLITVVMPTSSSVHGRLVEMISETGVGKNVNDRPRSPWNSCPQYSRYSCQRLLSLSSPNRTYSELIAWLLS